ncbi:MAG: hypothetical protein J5764_05330 [Bacteroidales bacterium]|nr:hypothetical protein [Bacteroidales bacterium]
MTESFKVAGHIFNLTLPDGCPWREMLSQYDGFSVPRCDAPAFSLSLTDELSEAPAEKVYDAPTEDGQTVIRLWRTNGGGWYFEMSPDARVKTVAVLLANEDFTEGRLYMIAHSARAAVFAINNSLMLLFAFRTAGMLTLEMHASVIKKDGRAYLFLAKSGTGKSTHSSLWLKNVPGSELLNDDNPIVRINPDSGEVRVYGSPWSGKTPCYKNDDALAGAFVQIRRSPENKITRLSLFEAYVMLYSSVSGLKTDSSMADGLHASLEKVAVNSPCYVLDCRPDDEAAIVCSSEVLNPKD